MLHIGDKAPLDVAVESEHGKQVTLKEFAGKYIVLFFYPKDMTPGCTTEACNFRDATAELQKLGAVVIGVSKDTTTSHEKFTKKHELNYPLLADTEHKLMDAFGVWGERKFMARTYMGTSRSTFLIDPQGTIVQVWEKADPKTHAEEVLDVMKSIQGK